MAVRRPEYPAIGELDWLSNRWWTRGSIEQYLQDSAADEKTAAEPRWMLDKLEAALGEVPPAVRQLLEADLPVLQVHGDFHPGNIIVHDDAVAGLLDWDETRVDWRAWEVARATWEFSRSPDGTLNVPAARRFTEAYRSHGGTICRAEWDAFVLLMRADILWGVLYSLCASQRAVDAQRGLPMDWPYLAGQLDAIDNLDGIVLAFW